MRTWPGILPGLALLLLCEAGHAAGAYELRTSTRHLEVTAGTTMFGLLNVEYPEHRAAWNEITAELVELNPDVFRNGDPGKMRVGTVMVLVDVVAPDTPPAEEPASSQATAAPATPAPVATSPRKPTTGAEPAVGVVEHVVGIAIAVNVGGQERTLTKNRQIHRGDVLATESSAQLRLRMKDDTLLYLREKSRMIVDDYTYYESEPRNSRGVITLVKGGLRAITGLLGSANRDAVRVNTPVATIGIRGTDYGLRFCEPRECTLPAHAAPFESGLYAGVLDGAIAVRNDTGDHPVARAEFVKTKANDAVPEPAPEAAALVFTEEELEVLGNHDEPLGFFAWLKHKIGGTPPP